VPGRTYLETRIDCHILDHEDNDMMRPVKVNLNPAAPRPLARPLVPGEQY
jgi:hypothetical protein